MLKNKKHISVVLSAIIVGSMTLTGCGGGGGGGDSTSTAPVPSARTVSGVAIDGELQGSTVTLKGLTTTTDDEGVWSISYTGDDSDVASVKGGTDKATGEAFEGTLKAELGAAGEEVVITPLSTLASSLVASGISKNDAFSKVAAQVGISVATLKANPIALLKSGDSAQKGEAAKAIKAALVVQKSAETLAKTIGGNATSTDFESTFAAAYEVVASKLNAQADTTAQFDTVMADMTSIVSELKTNLQGKVGATLVSEKLDAAKDSAAKVVAVIQKIDVSSLTSATNVDATLMSKSKAVEIATATIEKEMAKISASADVTAIAEAKSTAATTLKALTMIGGVNGIESKISSSAATLDASNFGDRLFTTETISTLAATFNEYAAAGLSEAVILEVGAKTANLTGASAIADAINEVLQAEVEAGNMSSEEVSAINVGGLADTTATTNTQIDSKVDDIVETPTEEEVVIIGGGGGGGGGGGESNTATATVPEGSFKDLSATGTISNTELGVNTILGVDAISKVFNLTRSKITLATTGTPTLAQKFDAIKSKLNGMLNIFLAAESTASGLNKNVMVTVLIKGQGTDYVAASTEANFSGTGPALTVSVPASGNVLRMGTSIDGTTLTATKANAGANSVTSTTNIEGKPVIDINAVSIINDFADNPLIGNTIKQYMVDYTTKAGTYDVYLLINDVSGSASFISSTINSVTIDATSLNTLVGGSGVTYTVNERAVRVRLTVQ